MRIVIIRATVNPPPVTHTASLIRDPLARVEKAHQASLVRVQDLNLQAALTDMAMATTLMTTDLAAHPRVERALQSLENHLASRVRVPRASPVKALTNQGVGGVLGNHMMVTTKAITTAIWIKQISMYVVV